MSAFDRAHVRFYAAVALAVAVVVVVLVARRRTPPALVISPPPLPDAIVEWCAEGLAAIPGGGCYAPAREVATRTVRGGGGDGGAALPGLLVYLHGRYAPEAAPEELERQARVARLATARGYSVLALRGRQGQCSDVQLATWWCWPSNEKNQTDGPAFVLRWDHALREVERREGRAKDGARAGRGRQVLLGFSNGAYFAALIASRELASFDAFAIAHGGPVAPMRPRGSTPPILLVDADDDPSGPEMSRLDADLTAEAWPHAVVVREGGHALLEWDIEMALTFFDRVATERLPLTPPLTARTTRRPTANPEADGDGGAGSGPDSGADSAPGSAPSSAPGSAILPAASTGATPPDPAPVLDPE